MPDPNVILPLVDAALSPIVADLAAAQEKMKSLVKGDHYLQCLPACSALPTDGKTAVVDQKTDKPDDEDYDWNDLLDGVVPAVLPAQIEIFIYGEGGGYIFIFTHGVTNDQTKQVEVWRRIDDRGAKDGEYEKGWYLFDDE